MKLNIAYPFLNQKKSASRLTMLLALTFFSFAFVAQARNITLSALLDLKTLEGAYQLTGNKNLLIQISAQGEKLILKESWTNNQITFNQKAELSFVAVDNPDFTLDFVRDKTGGVNQVTAFKRDVWVKVKATGELAKPSPAATAKLSKTYETIFTAFQTAINSNADDKIRSFVQTHMDASVIAAFTMDNLIEQAKSLHEDMGEIQLDPVKPINTETETASFKGKSHDNLFWMTFNLNPAGKIIKFEMKQ